MKKLSILLLMVCLVASVNAQKYMEKALTQYTNPEELVTLSETIPFNDAVTVLSKISEKFTGKKIVSTTGYVNPIGIQIDKMPYMKALLIIVQYNSLEYEERESVIVIKKKNDSKALLADDIYADINSREVRISAIFFEANVNEMKERGINWEFLLSKDGLSVGSGLKTFLEGKNPDDASGQQNQEPPPDFSSSSSSDFTAGDFTGTASTILKFFESENLGEIIARPNVTVRNKMKGRIQIGQDISIKQRDFAGNVIDMFVSTGTIIEVTPHVYTEDGIDYVLLKLKVERSTGSPDIVSTIINKTEAETEILMLDDEETAIGGLFVNEQITIRRGIPILKDLPWWVFGIRYLTGYNQEQINKKEVVILLKADIVPTLKERINRDKNVNLVQKQIDEANKAVLKYRIHKFSEKD